MYGLNVLHLTGYGVKIKVSNLRSRSQLTITDGRENYRNKPATYTFRPRKNPYDTIIIDGHSGYISLQALHWLSKNNIPVFILNFDGTLISSILPPTPIKADVRTAQMKASADHAKRFHIAYTLVQAKIKRTLDVVQWTGERYNIDDKIRRVKGEALALFKAKTVNNIRMVEGRVALRYWQAYKSVLPEWCDFQSRMTRSHRNNAVDPVNLALNYSYGVLEGECRKAINTVGLEPSIGFLHDFSSYQTKQSLVYDLQEPFRWIGDVTVLEAIESGVLDLKDFYFTGDDYRYRLEVNAKRRFLGLLKERFNGGVKYQGCTCKWDTVILRKTQELARYLTGKSKDIDFAEPSPSLSRTDSRELRCRILQLSQSEAKALGIGKSTLHYLRKHARNDKPFKIYSKVATKLR